MRYFSLQFTVSKYAIMCLVRTKEDRIRIGVLIVTSKACLTVLARVFFFICRICKIVYGDM